MTKTGTGNPSGGQIVPQVPFVPGEVEASVEIALSHRDTTGLT